MSTISFPGEEHASSSSSHEPQFYSGFEATSSFQMNPLSSHPPRTPRPSVATSSSHLYGAVIYNGKQPEHANETEHPEEDETDAEAVKRKAVERKVRKEEVWRDIVLTSNGRDKAFKIIQYSIRVYLLFHASFGRSRLFKRQTRPPWEAELVKRLESTASGLSFTRKMLLLFNWLSPLSAITASQAIPFSSEHSKKAARPFLHTLLYTPPPVLLELVQAFSDDVATCARLGLLGKRTGDKAGRFSDWCWFFATLVGLVENEVEKQVLGVRHREVESRLYTESISGANAKSMPKLSKHDEKELGLLQRQDYWLQVTRAKLAMDLIFVSYDIFRVKRAKKTVQTFTGLASAILSSAKLYDRHKSSLVKKASI